MPANLTPDYFKAEKWFKSATTNEEKILALEEMLRVMPKHKGTDHLRADLRKKLSKLREAPGKKGGASHADIFHVPKTGAGQIVLLGRPNCGKSSLAAILTNANVTVANYPFSTNAPVPGMVQFEDVQIELVDMPPTTADFLMPGQVGTYRNCDLIAMVIDLSGDIEEQVSVLMEFLQGRKLIADEVGNADEQGNVLGRPVFCICTKADLAEEGAGQRVRKALGREMEMVTVSTESGEGMEGLPGRFFELMGLVRVYSKPPGKEADMKDPFVLRRGATVLELAAAIHRDLAGKLKSARVWGVGVHPGQKVQKEHVLSDKDVVEIHY